MREPAVLPEGAHAEREPITPPTLRVPMTGRPLRKAVVVLDPGHGGADPGGRNRFYPSWPDKEVGLAVAQELRRKLGTRFEVHLTRESDVARDLNERVWKALGHWDSMPAPVASRDRDFVFISLHANQSPRSSARGAIVFRAPAHWLQLAEDLNDPLQSSMRRLGYSGQDIWPPQEAGKVDPSGHQKWKSMYLLDQLALRRGSRHPPPMSHVQGKPPAVLVELGFLTNPEEAYLLTQPEHHRRLADALAEGIGRYTRIDQRVATVRGIVKDAAGRPAAGAAVTATFSDSEPGQPPQVRRTTTDTSGRFTLPDVSVGVWILVVEHSGGTAILELDPDNTEVDVGTVSLRDAEPGTSRVFGRVLDGETSDALAAMNVRAFQDSNEVRTTSGPTGYFDFEVPTRGSWALAVDDPTGAHAGTLVAFFVKHRVTSLVLVYLIEAGERGITGKVLAMEAGLPAVQGVRVEAELATPYVDAKVESRTDAGGEFLIRTPYNSRWSLRFTDPQGRYHPEETTADLGWTAGFTPIPTVRMRPR